MKIPPSLFMNTVDCPYIYFPEIGLLKTCPGLLYPFQKWKRATADILFPQCWKIRFQKNSPLYFKKILCRIFHIYIFYFFLFLDAQVYVFLFFFCGRTYSPNNLVISDWIKIRIKSNKFSIFIILFIILSLRLILSKLLFFFDSIFDP